jgi:rhamnosyltransferase
MSLPSENPMRKAAALPRVAIMLTTYNGQEYLPAQLDSLLAQTGVEVHLYVFDDKSSDQTMAVLNGYAADNPGRFTIRQNDPNSGGTGINIFRNIPSIRADHDFVALADQDDVWLPEKTARAIAALEAEGAGLYFSNLLAWDGESEPYGIVDKAAPQQDRDYLFAGGSAGCTYVMTMPFFRHIQSVLEATDFSDARRLSHDWLLYFLARHYDFGVTASSDALIKYRIHPESQYGGMSMGGLGAILRKRQMLKGGFLREQIANTLRFARAGSEDRAILEACQSGRLGSIMSLLKYRSSLVRSKPRLLSLAVALLVYR